MNRPLVSIIVPIYNSEKYLPETVRSCTDQTYDNLEIILVDDGSADSSLDVCKKLSEADGRIKVIHQDNAGVSVARNTGLKNATGEYIFFLDSDDEIYPNAVDASGNEHCRYNDGQVKVYEGDAPLILSLKYDRQTNSACVKLFSRKSIEGVFFVEGHNINEDGYFVFQCYAKKPKLVQHNEVVYKYYRREASSTRGVFSEKYFDMIYFSDLKMKYIKENHPSLIELAKEMEVSTHLFLLEALCRDEKGKYKKETKKSIRIVRRRYFKYKPINKHEKKMATIVAFGLYPLYKKLFIAKFQK